MSNDAVQITFDWDNSVWFFDVDDTLINTADLIKPAAEGMLPLLTHSLGPEKATALKQRFIEIFDLLLIGHRMKTGETWSSSQLETAHQQLVENIKSHQEVLLSEGIFKKWSRQVWLKQAAVDLGIELDPELNLLAVQAYWDELARQTQLLTGVPELFTELKHRGYPVFLVTGSDAHLHFNDNLQFIYDPVRSEHIKQQRVLPLRELGLDFHDLVIGDPIDKPHRGFFEKAVEVAKDHLHPNLDPQHFVIVGDSYGSDLHVPRTELDFGLVVEIVPGQQNLTMIDSQHLATGNLATLINLLPR
ncbi:MAG TPA: HAD family hydrolase [Vitreimonas sp.]|nr:HAD family hydrolase [Vitreimonas sp.]